MTKEGISVVIPALNEQDAITDVIADLRKHITNEITESLEIIVIDDGSTDRTGEVARNEGARVIRHPYPGGYGHALKVGISAATNDIIITTDGDGTYPAVTVPKMLEQLQQGYHMSVGLRTGSVYRGSALKATMRQILRFLVEYTSGNPVPDANSGLRAFRKSHISVFIDQLCDTFSFSTSTTLFFLMNRCFIGYVKIDYFERVGETKVRIFRDSLRTLQYIVEAMARFNPLKLFLLVGAMSFAMAVLLSLGALLFSSSYIFYTALVFLLGAIASTLAGLFATVVKRPRRRDISLGPKG